MSVTFRDARICRQVAEGTRFRYRIRTTCLNMGHAGTNRSGSICSTTPDMFRQVAFYQQLTELSPRSNSRRQSGCTAGRQRELRPAVVSLAERADAALPAGPSGAA